MEYKTPISHRINALVRSGVITVGVHITRDGQDVWARFVQPHPGLGIDSCTSYTLEEVERESAKILDRTPEIRTGPSGLVTKTASPISYGFESVEAASKRGSSNELMMINKGGVKNFLPKDSLTPADFDRGIQSLFARACSVSETLGTPKIVSRITSKPDVLHVDSVSELSEWWSQSTPPQRFIILTRAKLFPQRKGEVQVKSTWLDLIEMLPCPFQDPETQMGWAEEGFSGEEEDDSSTLKEAQNKLQGGVSLAAW